MYSLRVGFLLLTQIINAALTDMWKDLAGFEDGEEATMRDLGYYTKLIQPGLRILSINTDYEWYVVI